MKRSILSSFALFVGALFVLITDASAQVVIDKISYSPQTNPPFTVNLNGTVPPCGASTGALTLSLVTSNLPAGTVYSIGAKSSIGNTFNQNNTIVTSSNGQLISQSYSGLAGSVSGVLYTFTITTPKIPPAQNDSSYVAVVTAYVYSTKTFSAVVNPVNPKCPVPPNKGRASVTVISGTSPYTYSWTNVSPNPGNVPNANNLDPGNYSVYVKDAFGCDTTMPFTITIRQPTVTLSVNPNPICDPVFPINITWNAVAEAGWVPYAAPGAFSWDGGVTWTSASSSTSSFTMFNVNTYGVRTKSVIFRDTAGCIANATLNVPVDTRPVFTASATPSVCPGATALVTANLTSCSSAGATCQFSFDGGSTYISPNSNVYTTQPINRDTTIIVRVQNSSGCFRDRTVSIDTAGKPRLTITVPTICPNAAYTINANCIANCASVEMSFNNGLFVTGSSQSFTQPTAPFVANTTTFPLVARGLNGCRLDTTVTVNVYTNTLVITKPADTTLCANNNGSTVTLTATGFQPATTLTWSTNPSGRYGDGSNANPLVVSSPTSGTITYTVTGTDTHGCTPRTATQSIVAKVQPVVTVTGPPVHCEGTTSSLNAAGASTYNWYNITYSTLLSSPGSTYNVSPAVATTYNVIGTDTRGCIDTATYVLPFKNRPAGTAAASPSTVCAGNTTTITISPTIPFTADPTGGYSFGDGIAGSYTTNPVLASAGPFSTNTVINTRIKDNDGCVSDRIPVSITVLPFNFRATASSPSCSYSTNGGIVINNLSGGTAPSANYSIDGGATVIFTSTATISNLPSKSYHIVVTDNSSPACSHDTSVVVAVPSPLVMTADTNHVICFGETSGSIPLHVTGGTLNFDYFRNDTLGTAIFANSTNRNPVYSNLGPGNYVVIVRDRNKCMDTATVIIRQPNSALLAPTTSSVKSCFGESTGSISIPNPSTGGWGSYVYTKTTAPTQTLTIPASLTSLPAATYNFNVTDAKGCVVTFSQAVLDNGQIFPDITAIQSVCDINGEIRYNGASGGTSPWTYSLVAAGPFGALPANETGLAVNTTRTLYVRDAIGCLANASVTVYNIPRAIPIISITPPVCPGENNGTITVDSTAEKGGSIEPFDFMLYTDTNPVVTSGSYTGIAANASITFASLTSGNYIMRMSDGACPNYVVDSFRVYTSPTSYVVVKAPYTGLNPEFAEMVVPVTPGFTASSISLASDVHENTGSVIIYNYKGGTPLVQAGKTQYQMSLDNDISFAYVPLKDTINNNTYVAFNNLAPGPHTIYVKDVNGCSDTIYIQVPGKFFIPNLITPNGDNANDYFEVVSLPDNSELRLYNRWGDRVFESSNYDNKYDFKGLADGVYYYDLQFMTGTHFKGWVQVIR